jgi:6-pyruvoyl-tetrahydropterin synthase
MGMRRGIAIPFGVSMITRSSITKVLTVTHHVPGLAGHAERAHPHLWTVRGEFEGDPIAAEGMSVVSASEAERFKRLLYEYQGGFLNDLVGPAIPSMEGFGLHLMERCSGACPELRRIIIFDAHHDPTEQHTFAIER